MTEERFVKVGDKVIVNPIVKKGQSFKYSSDNTLDFQVAFEGELEVSEVHKSYPIVRMNRVDGKGHTIHYTVEMLCYPDYTKLNHPQERYWEK